jgi:hypothetical protein
MLVVNPASTRRYLQLPKPLRRAARRLIVSLRPPKLSLGRFRMIACTQIIERQINPKYVDSGFT